MTVKDNWLLIPDDNLFSAVHGTLGECYRQDEKWGPNRIQNGLLWNAILTEETGEAAKEVLEMDSIKLQAELVQVAAVALNWIKALQRGEVPSWYEKPTNVPSEKATATSSTLQEAFLR